MTLRNNKQPLPSVLLPWAFALFVLCLLLMSYAGWYYRDTIITRETNLIIEQANECLRALDLCRDPNALRGVAPFFNIYQEVKNATE